MKLLVVYGLKTIDYTYLGQFYPACRFSQECANRSIPLRFLFPTDVPQFLTQNTSLSDNRKTLCLIRGEVNVAIVAQLEKAGFSLVNPLQAMQLANDKKQTALFLEKHGWPTPKTALAKKPAPWCKTFPLVAKPRFGSRGEGVSLLYTPEELAHLPKNTLIQEYIETSYGRDLRFLFAGNAILAIATRQALNGSFISNASTGAHMCIPPFGKEEIQPWKEMVLAISRESHLWYGSVDFLFLEEAHKKGLSLTVCEINASPGFESLEKECGYNIAGALLDRMIECF